MTKPYFWRTVISNAVYVDSNTGNDLIGDGTQQNPYQSLGRAYRGSATKPATIVCRGFFSEDMADGNHSCVIYGEYPGAVVFDGNDTYTIYGFTLHNMIVKNCIPGNGLMTVFSNNSLYAGVGRAGNSGSVGRADLAISFPGFAGSNCVFKNCGHYFGHIGGSGNKNVICNPRHNDTYKLFLWGNTNSTNWCIHGVKKEDRTVNKNSTATGNNFFSAIFTDVAFYINDHITFQNCVFGKDCTWWVNGTEEQIVLEGRTSEEKIAFLESKMAELGAANTNCVFKDCRFLDKVASQIYNNHEKGDFTVKAAWGDEIPDNVGVFGPGISINIPNEPSDPSYEWSTDIENCWDPLSATNNLAVENNEIVIKDLDYEGFDESVITTGLIRINITKYRAKSILAELASKFDKYIVLNDKEYMGGRVEVDTILPIGKYLVTDGSIIYKGMFFDNHNIITVTEEGTTCTAAPESLDTVHLTEVINPNIEVAVFVRMFSAIVDIQEGTSFTLDPDKIYVVMQGRKWVVTDTGRKLYVNSIVDGSTAKSVSSDMSFQLGELSNTNTEWCPCQTWGNLFVIKDGNAIKKDDEGIPLSSGNANCYNSNGNSGAVKTGYNAQPLNMQYLQFKIVERRVC